MSPGAETQPRAPRPVRRPQTRPEPQLRGRLDHRRRLLAPVVFAGLALGLILAAYCLAPFRTNILILGIDRSPEGTALGRSDTMILTTVLPHLPYVGMLSIPRDLWVTLPGGSPNRINTAHFFAEEARRGTGPEGAMEAVRSNFGVDVHYYVRVQFPGLQQVVDALGGLQVELASPTAGLAAGSHLLTGEQALAFVRNREGADDFTRMGNAQLVLRALLLQLLRPTSWPRIPIAGWAMVRAVDTDIPPWMWPRLALAILRLAPSGIDFRTVTRDMVQPFTTTGGANVLAPDWGRINPVLLEMFGQ